MKTIDLIKLLRGPERAERGKLELGLLSRSKELHTLLELCRWLTVEFRKYKAKQAPPLSTHESEPSVETLEQAAIRNQARQTLRGIQVVIEDFGRHPSPPPPFPSAANNTSLSLDLVAFLEPMLTGIVPLGPRADSTEIQLMCAKILAYCTDSKVKNTPFRASQITQALAKDSNGVSSVIDHGIGNIVRLLGCINERLQDYGLRILISNRIYTESRQIWSAIEPLGKISLTLLSTLEAIQEIDDDLPGNNPKSVKEAKRKDLVESTGRMANSMCLIQWMHQSLVSATTVVDQAEREQYQVRKDALHQAVPLRNLLKLWTVLQNFVVLPGYHPFRGRDKLIQNITSVIYWACWTDPKKCIPLLISEGSQNMLVWMRVFTTPPAGGIVAESAQNKDMSLRNEKDSLDQQSTSLEYLTKLIQIIVTSTEHQPLITSGAKPLLVIFLKRVLKFLDEIATPLVLGPNMSHLTIDEALEYRATENETRLGRRYAVEIVGKRPGILDGMLSIVSTCFGFSKEATDLSFQSKLTDLLFILISSQASHQTNSHGSHGQQDKGARVTVEHMRPEPHYLYPLSDSHTRPDLVDRIRKKAVRMLQFILRQPVVPRLSEISLDVWTHGCAGLAEEVLAALNSSLISSRDSQSRRRQTLSETTGGEADDEDDGMLKSFQLLNTVLTRYPKCRGIVADTCGARFFSLELIPVLLDRKGSTANTNKPRTRIAMFFHLLVQLGEESNIRIKMREDWRSISFVEILLGAGIKELIESEYSSTAVVARLVIGRCIKILGLFWFDKLGLERMTAMSVESAGLPISVLQPKLDLQNSCQRTKEAGVDLDKIFPDGTHPRDQPDKRLSVIPLLLCLLMPPDTIGQLRTNLMFRAPFDGSDLIQSHPLFESGDRLLVDAAMLLSHLSKLSECRQLILERPGAVWRLAQLVVEKTLADSTLMQDDNATRLDSHGHDLTPGSNNIPSEHAEVTEGESVLSEFATNGDSASDTVEMPLQTQSPLSDINKHERDSAINTAQLNKYLFGLLSRLLSAADSVQEVVASNVTTELFAAAMGPRQPFGWRLRLSAAESQRYQKEEKEVEGNFDLGSYTDHELTAEPILYPSLEQQAFLAQLLAYLILAIKPLSPHLVRIYQYAGGSKIEGNRADEMVHVDWLREYCALVILYFWEPLKDSSFSAESRAVEIMPSMDIQASVEGLDSMGPLGGSVLLAWPDILRSETVFGVICRMLTLEMDYVDEEESKDESQVPAMNQNSSTCSDIENLDTLYRRFSAGLAIQSLGWKHALVWQQDFVDHRLQYGHLSTLDWQEHVKTISGQKTNVSKKQQVGSAGTTVSFVVDDQVIEFEDRDMLSRVSPFFEILLAGQFAESKQDKIVLKDTGALEFEMLMTILQESMWTWEHLMPEDLELSLVLKILICANRFLVSYVRKLAECWLLECLDRRERKARTLPMLAIAKKSLRGEKRKFGQKYPGDEQQEGDKHSDWEINISKRQRQKTAACADSTYAPTNEKESSLPTPAASLDPAIHHHPAPLASDHDHLKEESYEDSLVIVYRALAVGHGPMAQNHPFFDFIRVVVQRMLLTLGSVAVCDQFQIWTKADEECGQETLDQFLGHTWAILTQSSR